MSGLSPSRKTRVVAMLWLLEVGVLVAAVSAAAWLRFLSDHEGLLTFTQTAPARRVLVALLVTMAIDPHQRIRPSRGLTF
ncbi:MAG: hypothetical protein M3R16_06440 [Pseudomonadota bacterium]|nr:hypothetical protein [Pseudomonadota bacterium]